MPRLLQIAGLMVWVMVALPVIIQGGANSTSLMIGWAIAYLLFAALFIADLRWPRLSLLAMQAACVVVVVAILCDGFEGGRAAFLLTPPYFGFQLLAFFTFQIVEREARMKERLRIAQDLHDSLGHHLTALTLNLESALLREGAEARADVEKAQSLARGLLADVREIVADSEPVDVEASLKELATNVPRPRVHLQVEEGLTLSHVILRCAQEIVTNAARHSAAENLWITIERSQGHLQLRAHDDGRGSDASPDGFGLRGMRARVEAAGGELQIVNQPGRGFGVIAILP